MANFDQVTRDKITSVHAASRVQQIIYSVYAQAKSAQTLLALYPAGTDPVFNSAVNAMFTASERSELAQMKDQIDFLVNDWETNHPGVIAGG